MSVIKYVLNVFGLMFIVIGLTCNISTTCGSVFCTIGIMYSFAMNAETKQMVRQKVIGKIFKRFR